MNVAPEPAVNLGGGHCCVCSAERGGICGHIGGPFVCGRHSPAHDNNPFITSENPLGAWDMPFESVPPTEVDIESVVVDSVDCTAAVADSPLGRLAVVIFDFHSSAIAHDTQPPRLTFIGTPDVVRNVRRLISAACNAAADAAERVQ